ncbi:hypothetical protein Pan216_41740 [Planctomycetes bacterium Pan216]|uniref:Methyltransferase type 11 domain-containing protein n=1 Tax=Kolteria novifilia TaxID=2527975 RepID=A0A518B8J2_9BACT|nr:hypothetical protein Pan216_41740 [Planctomycetes bacterium Pan216]
MKVANRLRSTFDDLNTLGANQFKSYISGSQYIRAYDLVSKYQNGSSVLDWGTGEGHFSMYLLRSGLEVTAFTVEDSCKLSPHFENEYPERYRLVSDPECVKGLPFDDSAFDMVTSIGVLEHVRETGGEEADSLREIQRVLKPGGIFLCYHFPNKYSWIEAITKHIEGKHNHTYKYTRTDIEQLTRNANLDLVEAKRYGLLPRLMFRFVPSFIGNSTSAAKAFNALDSVGSRLLSPICQNYYFIARKPLSTE